MMRPFEPSMVDLRLLGLNHEAFVRRATRRSLFGTSVASFALVVLGVKGGPVPLMWVGVAALVTPLSSWILDVARVRRMASRERFDMDVTVAVFLDLVNVLIAGGAGIETAMLAAANAGDGKSFQRIRRALAEAQGTRSSYWDTLRALGSDTGVISLEDVANSVQLAGEHGARIRLTLTAKARSLRSSNLARIEHDAQERTEMMGLPVVLMFLGFVILIGYPAFVSTIGAL